MKQHGILLAVIYCLLCVAPLYAQQVEQRRMQEIYDEVRTPYKYGLVIAPSSNSNKIDCPTIFREGDCWYMTYVCYNGKEGNDGRGYETWLAKSHDLLHWTTLGRTLAFPDDDALWDANQRGGFPALIDWEWGGTYRMQSYHRQHWMTYIGGHGTGYEAVNEPLSIGLAHTRKNITKAHEWKCDRQPLLSYKDKDAQWWEKLTQYKSTIYRNNTTLLGGHPFVMFYNAGGKDATHPKGERIGIALSNDMHKWTRYEGNPIFAHDTDGTITGDAQIVKMGDLFVMFYFSAFNPTRQYNAYNTFAASHDLVHWTDWQGEDLIIPSKPYDEMFAHKSYVVKHDGVVYHFYCAVNKAGQRGIALATSKRMGKSEVSFPTQERKGHRYEQSLDKDWIVIASHRKDTMHLSIPFNLDDYYGALQKEHGNLHGEATCTKHFYVPNMADKAFFLRFEGVGTYAEVVLNGQALGRYDIGRTSCTIDVSKAIRCGADNCLTVKVSHPAGITDMPWVCGGCSSEWGFSEGSQPFGIFRPIVLEATDKVRIEPFGVHVWSNTTCDSLFVDTEIKNYSKETVTFQLVNKLCNDAGAQVLRLTDEVKLKAGESVIFHQEAALKADVRRWSVEEPYLYKVQTIIKRNGKATESTETDYGFRTIQWPRSRGAKDNCFYLNGKRTYINGVCEYEHLFGQSHAFTNEQIETRIAQVQIAGFNAFRDAHQPHNLYYMTLLGKRGILWWTQFSAHIWFDTKEFRESFKRHLRQWVKERRNSPAVILWGLQNESTLPKDFAEECTQILREMDPTCGTQRLVTTCNGGEGTDWNVVQNWSGTYGGDITRYGEELKTPAQLLNGEYGAWRTLGNHTGEGYTEERFMDILQQKMTQAETVRDSVCGQFLWLLNSHDNPGRRQPDEALRRIDKVGPFNYKGLLTIWDQPTDAFYWYKNRASDSNTIISFAEASPTNHKHHNGNAFRLNCGGDAYTDADGNHWLQDTKAYSHSWGDRFKETSSYQCSQTTCTKAGLSPLYSTSRFGRHELYYTIPATKGDYIVELHFVEPWYGADGNGGDYEGWRMFDVAINDSIVLHDLDIWGQIGYGKPYLRSFHIRNSGKTIRISFPRVASGQAVISAIAIYGDKDAQIGMLDDSTSAESPTMWADFDRDILITTPDSLLPPRTKSAIEVDGHKTAQGMEWKFSVGVAKVYSLRFKYWNGEKPRKLHVKLTDAKGVIYRDDDISFLQTQTKATKRKMTSITTGSFINAGTYRVELTGEGLEQMIFDALTIE